MTRALHVPAQEREVIRVLALDLAGAEAEALAQEVPNGAPSDLAAALGVAHLDRTHVEIFPTADLKGVGLTGYLAEGLGIAPETLEPDRAVLEAETGYVVVVHSAAFAGAETLLSPEPPLRYLGTYPLAQTAPPAYTAPAPLDDTTTEPQPRRRAPARMPRALGLLGLLGAAVIALIVAYFAGGKGP